MVKIDVLVLNGSSPAALGITLDVIDNVNRLAGETIFEWRAVVADGSAAQLRGGVTLPAQPLAKVRPRDLVVVLGRRVFPTGDSPVKTSDSRTPSAS